LARKPAKGDYLVQKDPKQSQKNQKDKFNFWNILGHFGQTKKSTIINNSIYIFLLKSLRISNICCTFAADFE